MNKTATILLILLTSSACRRDSAYDHYVHEACAQLKGRQDQLIRDYELSRWERYDWDQDREELVFSQGGTPRVIAKVQFVGSYSKRSKTWRWAWANDTVLPGMKMAAFRVRQMGVDRGWKKLVDAQWDATEEDGWAMTGVMARVLDAKGAYRSPDESGIITFMVVTSIRWAA